jgi:hypothetical protein
MAAARTEETAMAEIADQTDAPPAPGPRCAVVVGTNYTGNRSKLPELLACENDATDVAAALHESGYEVTALLGSVATGQVIRAALAQAATTAGPGGLLLFYFAGHAAHTPDADRTIPFLIPHDFKAARFAATALPLPELAQTGLGEVGFGLLLLDTSFSGYAPTYDAGATHAGRMVLGACDVHEFAREILIHDQRRGPFTYAVTDHWRNYPGAVDVNSLYSSVAQALEIMEMPAPVLSGVQKGRTLLRPARPGAPAPATPATPPAAPDLVIAEATVKGLVKRDLVTLLTDVFPTPAELGKLTDYYLGQPLSAIPTEANDTGSLVFGIVNWCLIQGGNTLGTFLTGALHERPKRADLRALVTRLATPPP